MPANREFTCRKCGSTEVAKTTRGPLPSRCSWCKATDPVNPQPPTKQARAAADPVLSVPGIPDQLWPAAEATRGMVIYENQMAQALAMRLRYADWADIARACGYPNARSAFAAVQEAMKIRRDQLGQKVDALRDQELDRLDILSAEAQRVLDAEHLAVSAGRVVEHEGLPMRDHGPVLAAINTLTKVSESRRKLLGLDSAQKVDAAVTVQYTVEGIAEGDMP